MGEFESDEFIAGVDEASPRAAVSFDVEAFVAALQVEVDQIGLSTIRLTPPARGWGLAGFPVASIVDVVDQIPAEARLDLVQGALVAAGVEEEPPRLNLLLDDTVEMTVFAQDPEIKDDEGHDVLITRITVPADRLQRGPRNHRFHVVDIDAGSGVAKEPVTLHLDGFPWAYQDRWAELEEREVMAQHVFAVAAHTLALFERHLGRRVRWRSGWPHLYLVPDARVGANANYAPTANAVLFGRVPRFADRSPVHTCLSYDVVAHEVTHAILDGLRPRYTEPGLADQLAFHEALADLVALLSVFGLNGVAEQLLQPDADHRVRFLTAARSAERDALPHDAETGQAPLLQRKAEPEEQTAFLKGTALLGLAEQLGRARAATGAIDPNPGQMPLRRSVALDPDPAWRQKREFDEPHRRAEILVAAFTHTLVDMWVGRLSTLDVYEGGLNAARVAEEGRKSAAHLLGMILRSLDYLPPVELEFEDVIDAVVTADLRLSPNDEFDYRGKLEAAFKAFGIKAPRHQILDRDGQAAPSRDAKPPAADPAVASFGPDPDESTIRGIRYEHLNHEAMHSSPEEVYEFIWNNSKVLGIDVRLSTKVDRVIGSTRVGPDGLIVTEILADYTQFIGTTAAHLPEGMTVPEGMPSTAKVDLWGGGVLVFDQFGRFRLHQRKLIGDIDRQDRRLQHLFDAGLVDANGNYGGTDGLQNDERFALLHQEPEGEIW